MGGKGPIAKIRLRLFLGLTRCYELVNCDFIKLT